MINNYYKKAITVTLILILISGASSINVTSKEKKQNINSNLNCKISFSNAHFEEVNNYISIKLEESTSYLNIPGEPVLPVISKVFTFPFKTKIKEVIVENNEYIEKELDLKIQPAGKIIPLINTKHSIDIENQKIIEDKDIYLSLNIYPEKNYDYKISTGLQNNELVTIVTIYIYPIRYCPQEKIVYQSKNANIQIKYEKSQDIISSDNDYDLIIISPKRFSETLKELVKHKNNHNVKTLLKTTESIYLDSLLGKYDARGRDKAEKIKYFIKYALDEWNIKYVLLVGGRIGQFKLWNLPVRYTHIEDISSMNYLINEYSFLSDLYYADIYNGEGKFSSWDTNNNGVFGEWNWGSTKGEDEIDLIPDVYVGRLPCRNIKEVQIMVDKIIFYENNAFNQSWFKNIIVAGGDSFKDYKWNILLNYSLFQKGNYSIFAQTYNDESISDIDSINLTIKKSKNELKIKEDSYIIKKDNSADLGVEITQLVELPLLNNILISGIAYNKKPPGDKINVDIWITNKTGDIVYNTTLNVTSYFEGEIATIKALESMPSYFNNTTLWASSKTLSCELDVVNAINNGSGFLYLTGHGNPLSWATHPPLENIWINGLSSMNQLKNNNKLPICIVGGCHNSQFDVTIFNLLKNPYKNYYRTTWIPECWSWRLTNQQNAGSIATIGNTGLGYGTIGDYNENDIADSIEYLSGWLELEFFRQYGEEEQTILGDIFSQSITNYINTFPCMTSWVDSKTVQEWILFGDPSLKIGGYLPIN